MAQHGLDRRRVSAAALALALLGGLLVATGNPAQATIDGVAAGSRTNGAPPAASALLPEPRNTTWARQILGRYLDTRTPPTGGVLALGAGLDGASSASGPIRSGLLTPDPVESRVKELYQQLLERAADPGGLAFWSSRILDGRLSYEHLVVTLLISSEAHSKAGGTPQGYTDWVYEHLLERSADPSGRAFWIGRLESGTSRDRFVRSFLRSSERARSVVQAGFGRYLQRAADPGGLSHWMGRYTSARVGELDLAVSLLASNESRGDGCGYDPQYCLLPFPSNRYMHRNSSTATDWQVGFKPEWMPSNASGTPIDPTEWNRNDGFSPGQAALSRVAGIDLAQTGAAPLTDIGASLAADAPIVVLDVATGERHPYFAELDANAGPAGDPILYVRPATNYTAGHTYVVALRSLRDGAGAAIATDPAFAAERDRLGDEEPGSDYDDDLLAGFEALATAGVNVADSSIHQAWTFTVASTKSTTGRMLHIRDQALAALGGGAPAFTVDDVIENPRAGVARRVVGTYEVPNYLTGDGSAGQAFATGPDGLPERNGSYTANFDCELPDLGEGELARLTVYGHGLFGSHREVRSGAQAAMVGGYDMAYCATDWIGMSEQDFGNAVTILQDVSTFRTLTDRSQQGILNTIVLGRLMQAGDGLSSNAAFQDGASASVLDTSALFYDGNSQGAVIGGAYIAVDPSVEAGVVGVAGMNYSTLLERSVDFDPFFALMETTYPDPNDRVVGLQLIQMLWDRGETNGYAAHLNADNNLPGTPDKRVLVHTALGDHQVATLTAEIEARTAGMAVHRPVYLEGRTADVAPAWGLDAVVYPSTGSALVVWDSGSPLSPLENVPPRAGDDPHQDPRNSPDAQAQKSAFLVTGGMVVDVCGAATCTAAG